MASEDSIGLILRNKIVTVRVCMLYAGGLCMCEVCVGQKVWTVFQVRQGEIKKQQENRDGLYFQLWLFVDRVGGYSGPSGDL